MQRVTLVRYTAKPGRAAENETLSRAVFRELQAAQPPHVAYALFRDGDDFLHVFLNLAEDDSAAVTERPTFKAFSQDMADRTVAAPEVTRLAMALVDAYGFAQARTPA